MNRATNSPGLTLRSIAKRCVSKGEAAPSFETRPSAAPQDEADKDRQSRHVR
jgi:hypothetical protein